MSHLFFHCIFTQSVWSLAPFKEQLDSLTLQDILAGLLASKELICLPPTGIVPRPLFSWICWGLWTARNNKIFNNRFFTAEETLTKALQDSREWLMTQESDSIEAAINTDQDPDP
ncbi:hypothetical protein AALP_AA8G254400 [Arabis alpina]|uniref:Reverse transcriptase zinc-binding domain-containing protein n=1 Tax=Arabis alpina TaxID=50452 RepID=A0A087G9C6_ARAAL|nr:hypothetical protein AALP_AA8G254400 [Arabis alpina]